MPYLMEYDNWGGLVVDDRENIPREELAWRDWWGYDQIAWFANQPEEGRNHFLEYTYKWTEINNPNAYFELPFRRMIHKRGSGKWLYPGKTTGCVTSSGHGVDRANDSMRQKMRGA